MIVCPSSRCERPVAGLLHRDLLLKTRKSGRVPARSPPAGEGSVASGDHGTREKFRRWCGGRFEEWHTRARRYVIESNLDGLDLFDGDWHPDGSMAFIRERSIAVVAQRPKGANGPTPAPGQRR